MTTAIHTETDLVVSALVLKLTVTDALQLACDLQNKSIRNYDHLDQGRRAMCAGNMLRGVCRKNPSMIDTIMDAVEKLAGFYPEGFDPRPPKKAKKSKKAAKPGAALMPAFNWPKSKRFQYAAMANGEQKFFYNEPKGLDFWKRPEQI